MKTIVYFHGYGSSSKSNSATCLAKEMPGFNVIAPDIPVDPEEALPFLKSYCAKNKVDLIIGTSMGGMYAMQMSDYPRICVNPALHMSQKKDILQVGTFERFQPTADGQTHFTITTSGIWSSTCLTASQVKTSPCVGASLPTVIHWSTARTSLHSISLMWKVSTASTA